MLSLHKPSEKLAIREMQPSDIAAVGELASRVWWAHYASIISEAQIRYMLDMMYSHEQITDQVTTQLHRYWLLHAGARLVGYVSVEPSGRSAWHIHKLYVDNAVQRKGLGSKLLNHILSTYHPKELTLCVNRNNFKALNFYFRNGFTIASPRTTDIGHGFVMEDYLMKRIA
jgi:diamine N-acetyltransferase